MAAANTEVQLAGRHVRGGETLFADDTPLKLLVPGAGRTKAARVCVYARDERPRRRSPDLRSSGVEDADLLVAAGAAAWLRRRGSTDRRAKHPFDYLKGFEGSMHGDGYAGFNDLYRTGVACMAHVRRKFVDVQQAQGSAIAEEALRRIAELYAVEKPARGRPPEERVRVRQQDAKPVFDELKRWLGAQLTRISGTTPLAGAIRYALSRLPKLRPYLEDGRLELDNNSAERAMRGLSGVRRKN